MTNQDITHLTQAIIELKGQIERMSERQEEMVEDVKKIKEAVYNPDQGSICKTKSVGTMATISIKNSMGSYNDTGWFGHYNYL